MKLETLKSRLALYLEAERKILSGQSYRVGNRELVRADLKEVRATIEDLTAQIDSIESPGGRIKAVEF
ncbi:MAG: hypothetical protein IKD73_02940 [Selenomonadaceae bacterium]|nr:hypothetical protein [Selenomonadaceae bacterium]